MMIAPRPAARFCWQRWPRYFAAFRRELFLEAAAFRRPGGTTTLAPRSARGPLAGGRPRALRDSR